MTAVVAAKLNEACGAKLLNRLLKFFDKNWKIDINCDSSDLGKQIGQQKSTFARFETKNGLSPNKFDNNHDRSKPTQEILSPILSSFRSLQIEEKIDDVDLSFADCIQLIQFARAFDIRQVFEFAITCMCTEHAAIIEDDEQIYNILKSLFPPVSVYIMLKIFTDYDRISRRFEHSFSFEKPTNSFKRDSMSCWNMILFKTKGFDDVDYTKDVWQRCGLLAFHCAKCDFIICRSCGNVSRINSSAESEICFICKTSLNTCACVNDDCNICSICAETRKKCNCHFVSIDVETWKDFLTEEVKEKNCS